MISLGQDLLRVKITCFSASARTVWILQLDLDVLCSEPEGYSVLTVQVAVSKTDRLIVHDQSFGDPEHIVSPRLSFKIHTISTLT